MRRPIKYLKILRFVKTALYVLIPSRIQPDLSRRQSAIFPIKKIIRAKYNSGLFFSLSCLIYGEKIDK